MGNKCEHGYDTDMGCPFCLWVSKPVTGITGGVISSEPKADQLGLSMLSILRQMEDMERRLRVLEEGKGG